ncbi:CAP domain-containing protein [Amycolatopsis sp. NPDC058986]|uniref:CAP domain-containing protein n=1 Tax=unclassified Amycolatopsis TaxID=2618356 RepID=UPI00366C579F
MVSLSVLIGGLAAGGGTLWLHQGQNADTLSNSTLALRVPDTRGGPQVRAAGPQGTPSGSTTSAPATSGTPETTPSKDEKPPTSEAPASSASPASQPPATTPSTSQPKPKAAPAGGPASQVVDLVNDERAKAGCGPVSAESHLATAAQGHSDDMSARDYFSHNTPEGATFDQRIRDAGYAKPGAENIAKGATTAAKVMQMWMNSSGHRANILNCSLTRLGVGVATDGWYWTQDFGY